MKIKISLALVLFILSLPSYGQNSQGINEIPHIFNEEFPLEITLRTDLNKLTDNRDSESVYQYAEITIENTPVKHTFPAEINIRGNFRRDFDNCDFPPLSLKFDKNIHENSYFKGNNKVKIVTHCKSGYPEFEQFIIREYITYKIYNILTDYSFRVRLANITYHDTGKNHDPFIKPAFLIEDIDHLAARNDMKEFEGRITMNDLREENAIRLSLFQYMIGNTDWIVNLSKNLKFTTDGSEFCAVPYDFDYTAIVGTDYSLGNPNPVLPDPERIYKGNCFEFDNFMIIADEISSKRRDIYKMIRKHKALDYKSREHMIHYLNDFFYLIRSSKKVREVILSKCVESPD